MTVSAFDSATILSNLYWARFNIIENMHTANCNSDQRFPAAIIVFFERAIQQS